MSQLLPDPTVTAIVSTYASARFIRGCLEDLLSQTLYAQGKLEIVVIDSGSPEDESAIVSAFAERFANIRLERTQREPLYAAWNRAIKLARGRYITNANTDDRHHPEALETLASHLDSNPAAAVVYGDSLVTTTPNETWEQNTAIERLNWPRFSYEALQGRCIIGPQPMWRKSLHDRWGSFDESLKVAGDYEFWLRIGREERFDRHPATLGLYLQNPSGLEHGSGVTVAETQQVQQRYKNSQPAREPLAQVPSPADAKTPTVSVIIATYNRPEFLQRALSTLCQQSFKDFEVIVVNDCGAPLEDLLQSFSDRLAITYIRHAVNRDRAAARNTGIRASRGRYIAYLDDDDGLRPNHLQLLVAAARKDGCMVAYSQAEWIEEVKTDNGYRAVSSTLAQDPEFSRDRLMVVNYIPILSFIHDRACLDEVGMFDESLGTHEDWDLLIRLANRYRFAYVPQVTADVSIRRDGSSTTSSKQADFVRTIKIVHERYHYLVADRPEILEAQAAVIKSTSAAVPPSPPVPKRPIVQPQAPSVRNQQQTAVEAILTIVESQDDGRLIDLVLVLQNSPALLRELLASPLAEPKWKQLFLLARQAFRIGALRVAKAVADQVFAWQPGYWFARELPRQFEGYYSQMGQDRIIERFFLANGAKHHRFVEVGAFDGVHYSNVRRLQERYGWSGVCVEPVRKNFQRLLDSYAGTSVKCVRAAASNKAGTTSINVSTYPHLPEWGTDVASLEDSETGRWDQYGAIWNKEEVAIQTLDQILEAQGIEGIDLLCVDAEGHDLAVLEGLDFGKHSPSMVVVEYGQQRGAIQAFLEARGYSLLHDNQQDLFMQKAVESTAVALPATEHLLHPNLLKIDYFGNSELSLETVGPRVLLSPHRFDLCAKLLYARHLLEKCDSEFAEDVYKQHLQAFNGFKEEEKQDYSDFRDAFHSTLISLKRGFDPSKSLIPADKNNVIVDGAHRVAASILFDQPLAVLRSSKPSPVYNYEWFLKRGLPLEAADAMACEYARWSPQSVMVTLFPAAQGREAEVQSLLAKAGTIVYRRDFELRNDGPALFVWQMYRQEPWVGEAQNLWEGTRHKARGCFPSGKGTICSFLFHPSENTDLRALKTAIRALYGVANDSVHINDTHAETQLLANLCFNHNSHHFLNNAKMTYLANFWELFGQFAARLALQSADIRNFCIDGSASLAAYGLRDCRDIDFLHTGLDEFSFGNPALIGSHNLEMADHVTSRDDILHNPANHFYFHGMKFVSLGVLKEMKLKRGEAKDLADVALIDALAEAPHPVHRQTNPVSKRFSLKDRPVKIVGLVTARNESTMIEQSLRALAQVTDAIVVLDDASTDNTVAICESLAQECRIAHVIRKFRWYRDEPGDRNRLLQAARSLGGTHFIVLDADECFTSNLLQDNGLRGAIAQMGPGEILELQWLQLWRSTTQYRSDQSVWSNNYKPFVFCDDWSSFYTSEFIHTPRIPAGLKGPVSRLHGPEHGAMHFQFVNWDNLLVKQAWYRCLERIRAPEKSVAEINARYAPSKDESNLGLLPVPSEWFSGYKDFDFGCYQLPDAWRKEQVLAWFSQYGRDFFSGLDIADVNWDAPVRKVAAQPARRHMPTDNEIWAKFPLEVVEGPQGGLVRWNGVNGFLTIADVVELYKAAYDLPQGARIVEVGSFFGLSAVVMGRALLDAGNLSARIHCIDLWDNYYGSSLPAFKANCEACGVASLIVPMQENCVTAVRHFDQASVDLAFIDGDHGFAGASRDLAAYAPLVKPEGRLLGHDYAPDSQGVVRAVAQFLEKKPFFDLRQPPPESSVFMLTPLPTKANDVLVYVGLHKGDSFEKMFDKYRLCIGIEANPSLASAVAEKFKAYPNVHIFHGAATNHSGFVDLHLTNDGGGASSLGTLDPKFPGQGLQHTNTVKVPAIFLPELLSKLKVTYISEYVSDIQGMDLTVLSTLKPWIEHQRIGRITCETTKDGYRNIYKDIPSNELSQFHALLDNQYEVCGNGWGVIADGQRDDVPDSWWEFDCRWAPRSVAARQRPMATGASGSASPQALAAKAG